VGGSFEVANFSHEHFAAPDCPIVAVPGAVETDANERARVTMLGCESRDVGPVVLHANEW